MNVSSHYIHVSNIFFVLLVVIFSFYAHANADSIIERTSNCTTSDFIKPGNCTLSCSGSLAPLQDPYAHIVEHNFKYYSTHPNESALLFNSHWHINGKNFEMKLPLTGYNAGHYVCEILVHTSDGIEAYSHSFKIDPNNKGVNLGSKCESSADCLAANAACRDVTCSCGGNFFIPYNDQPDSPACLSAVPYYGDCNTNEQCQVFSWHNYCIHHKCLGNEDSDPSDLSSGMIAGIAIGSIVFGLVLMAGGRAIFVQCTS